MSVKTIQVANTAILDTTVTSYLNQGFILANRTDTRATLQKIKPPLSAAMIIIGLIIPFIGWLFLIFYLISHGMKPASEVIELSVRAGVVK